MCSVNRSRLRCNSFAAAVLRSLLSMSLICSSVSCLDFSSRSISLLAASICEPSASSRLFSCSIF
ncbi:hypothetical protein GO014_12195 [Devosia sp. L53-10-65]|uniref:Secreted protein n=1 Tax=Devosia marina TaxID=2683198 RepID=A0A7X3K4N1_9HYPH|nr:hypothetical protein [Devosia marina]